MASAVAIIREAGDSHKSSAGSDSISSFQPKAKDYSKQQMSEPKGRFARFCYGRDTENERLLLDAGCVDSLLSATAFDYNY